MASPPPKPQRRQAQHCYYEGYLEKRSANEKVSQRFWASLCGNMLYFYNTSKDSEYVDRIDLDGFISLLDDNSRDRNLEAARLKLRTKEGEFKITVPTLENRELWKGYIQTVSQLSVPSSLNLLPGQMHVLEEVARRERERRSAAAVPDMSSDLYLALLADMPACFHDVSRREAMGLLEKYADCGNMLLRPSKDGSMAISTRQDLNGSLFHHYRVNRMPEGGFLINLGTPIPCADLHEMISCLVEKTSGALQPFVLENIYNDNITFVQQNAENGEKHLKFANFASQRAPPPGNQKQTANPGAASKKIYLNDDSDEELESCLLSACTFAPACAPKSVNAKEAESTHNSSGARPPMPLPKFAKKFGPLFPNTLPRNPSSEDQACGSERPPVAVPPMCPIPVPNNKQAIPKLPAAMGKSTGNLPFANAKEPESTHSISGARLPLPLPKFAKKSPVPNTLPRNPSSEDQSSRSERPPVAVAPMCPIPKQAIPKPPVSMGKSTINLADALSAELKKKVEGRRGSL